MDPEGRPWLWWPGESGIAKELPGNAWIEGFMKGQYDEPNK